jgi:hypothetical protein
MEGVSAVKRSKQYGALVECHYATGGDTVIVHLDDSSSTVGISDLGPAACDYAIRLQASFDEPLRIIDECYNFDLQLKDYRTPADLDAGIWSGCWIRRTKTATRRCAWWHAGAMVASTCMS